VSDFLIRQTDLLDLLDRPPSVALTTDGCPRGDKPGAPVTGDA